MSSVGNLGPFACFFYRRVIASHGRRLFSIELAAPQCPIRPSPSPAHVIHHCGAFRSSVQWSRRAALRQLCSTCRLLVSKATQDETPANQETRETREKVARPRQHVQDSPAGSAGFVKQSVASSSSSSSSSSSYVTPRLKELVAGLHSGDRAKLATAITLVESKHPVKHKQAQWMLTKVLSQRSKQLQLGAQKPTLRVGISGPPGAGKSTLIETFGQLLIKQGMKVAVLAVDPSSSRSGGSILGDKTRMTTLTKERNAYIRPSPTGGNLGGVNRSTSEAIILCEGAGYDVILVETVGVGQSETAVCNMVDIFILLIPPAAGDELQGLKKGIVEMADLVVINKADGDLLPAARRIKAEYVSAVKFIRSKTPHWHPKVLLVSALANEGIAELWEEMQTYWHKMKEVGEFDVQRKNQQRQWLWAHVEWQLRHRFRSHPAMALHIANMEERVMAGSLAPGTAADLLLDEYVHALRN